MVPGPDWQGRRQAFRIHPEDFPREGGALPGGTHGCGNPGALRVWDKGSRECGKQSPASVSSTVRSHTQGDLRTCCTLGSDTVCRHTGSSVAHSHVSPTVTLQQPGRWPAGPKCICPEASLDLWVAWPGRPFRQASAPRASSRGPVKRVSRAPDLGALVGSLGSQRTAGFCVRNAPGRAHRSPRGEWQSPEAPVVLLGFVGPPRVTAGQG